MEHRMIAHLESLEDEPFAGYSAEQIADEACQNPRKRRANDSAATDTRSRDAKRKLEAFSGDCERVYVSFCRYGNVYYGYLDGEWESGKVWVTHWRAIDTNRYTITTERIETELLAFAPEGVKYPTIVLSELDEAMHAGKLDDWKALQSRLEDLWFTLHGYR